jgi:hypothetical protein
MWVRAMEWDPLWSRRVTFLSAFDFSNEDVVALILFDFSNIVAIT